ncbi:MAG TPA: choice-of-anchor D domain-containing protein [Candidatus Kapabacteria bacterium]|nr:choice-of-anchor D domain-containing protein [Candidatus Kapabacteria bacterium]
MFRPDRAAPGMNVVVEILAPVGRLRPFGYDSLDAGNTIVLVHPADSNRVLFGPPIVSWNGNLIQVPLFVLPNAAFGPVPFFIRTPPLTGLRSDTISFIIDTPQHLGNLTGNVTIGNGFGQLSAGNTLLVDSLIVTNGHINFSLQDPDTLPGNPRLQPVTVLSKGPVRLTNSTISVDADSLDGGPGGGGGGHGYPGAGGIGFTGGGSSSDDTSLTNTGSAANATTDSGGACATGVMGGGSEHSDHGGGGGTGAPYGASGAAGVAALNSPAGGYGGGSGGGEAVNPSGGIEYGGGGGGFGTPGHGGGQQGGTGANGGNPNGGRFLVPLAGGSGGGAGNAVDVADGFGGSGGGGGGSLQLVSFDSVVLISSTLSARGDSGTVGINRAAGGGGGSGGAIYLATPLYIRDTVSRLNVDSGSGGQGGVLDGLPGGAGGLGRIRIDGATNFAPTPSDASVWVNGISLSPNTSVPVLGFVRLSGAARDLVNTLDSIRIYYRTRQSAWQFVDTVRAPNGSWSKWLPLPHDSLLFADAMVEVMNPAPGTGTNGEPSWLVSDASLSIIHHLASPFLVSEDTLNFGAVRLGRCKTLLLRVTNDGEKPLVLDIGTFSGSTGFSIVPDSTITIPAYTADTFEVRFCPESATPAIGKLSFTSNDSANSPKIITLLGTGLAIRDSLAPFPDSIRFERVLLDSCATDTITLKSVGHDTLYLSHSFWNDPPFTLRLVPLDTALDSGATRKLLVTFCPLDSGNFSVTQVLDERGDSIVITGRGVIRRAASIPAIDLGTLCLGHAGIAFDTISNLGNDTISFFAFHGRRILRELVGLLLEPNARDTIAIPISADSLGSFTDTVSFELADTTLTTVLHYRVTGASMNIGSTFPFACIGDSATDTITISSNGLNTLVFSNFSIAAPFFRLNTIDSLAPGEKRMLFVRFLPGIGDTLERFDTLRFFASTSGCDSNIAIVLSGIGVDSGPAAKPLAFDSVLVGKCQDDSLLIDNPCGPASVIDTILFKSSDFQRVSSFPDTIPSLGSLRLAVQFCPSGAGMESDTAILVLHTGEHIRAPLTGVGVVRTNPWAHFTISNTIVRMGDQAVSSIRFDSSSLTGQHSIWAVVSFNPTVLSPVSSFPNSTSNAGNDSEVFYAVLHFQGDTGFIESITWNTLAGPNDSSTIDLSITTDAPLTVVVKKGSVSLTDCFGLAGRLASSGSYALGPVTPNPAAGEASVMMTLGSDGYVEAAIYDMAGGLAETVLQQNFTRGNYQLTIPTDGLSSGRYILEINSMGWRAVAPFVVDR